jgi:hypothetical protein
MTALQGLARALDKEQTKADAGRQILYPSQSPRTLRYDAGPCQTIPGRERRAPGRARVRGAKHAAHGLGLDQQLSIFCPSRTAQRLPASGTQRPAAVASARSVRRPECPACVAACETRCPCAECDGPAPKPCGPRSSTSCAAVPPARLVIAGHAPPPSPTPTSPLLREAAALREPRE